MFLYVSGKQHKVLIDNKDVVFDEITYSAGANYKIWVDNQEIGVIEKDERMKAMVTGKNHKIILVEIKDEIAIRKKYEKVFKLKVNEDVVINIPAIINDLSK